MRPGRTQEFQGSVLWDQSVFKVMPSKSSSVQLPFLIICFWCLPPVGEVGSVGFVGFLVEGTGACFLVGRAGFCLFGGQWCVGVSVNLV